MDITIQEVSWLIYQTLPKILNTAVFTLILFSILGLVAYLIVGWHSNKIKEPKLYTFTQKEWDQYVSRLSDYLTDELIKRYDLFPKGSKPQCLKDKLNGTWCNDTDSMRYYISERGGFQTLAVEDRVNFLEPMKIFILRHTNSNPIESNIFFAEGGMDECMILGYDQDEDTITLGGAGILERIEAKMNNPQSFQELEQLTEIPFSEDDFEIKE